MECLVEPFRLWTMLRWFATVDLLSARLSVHHDAKSSHHVHCFSVGVVAQILLAIGSAIAIDVLNLELNVGSFI